MLCPHSANAMATERESYSSSSAPSLPSDVSFWVALSWHGGDSHYVTAPLGGEGGRAAVVIRPPPPQSAPPNEQIMDTQSRLSHGRRWHELLRDGCQLGLLASLPRGPLQCCEATSPWRTSGTVMRRGIMPEALGGVLCRVASPDSHRRAQRRAFTASLGLCGRETKSDTMRLALGAADNEMRQINDLG